MDKLIFAYFGVEVCPKFRSQSDIIAIENAPKLSFKRTRNLVPFLKLEKSLVSKTEFSSSIFKRKKNITENSMRKNILSTIDIRASARLTLSKSKRAGDCKNISVSKGNLTINKRLSIYDFLKRLS